MCFYFYFKCIFLKLANIVMGFPNNLQKGVVYFPMLKSNGIDDNSKRLILTGRHFTYKNNLLRVFV